MKIAVFGTGGIAQKAYFPLLLTMPDMEIVSVFSRTQASCDQAKTQWGFDNTTMDIQAVLDKKPQAAFVISSTESHYDICRRLLENGVDVYSEKALTSSSAQSFELGNLAEKMGRILAVGFNRRYALLYLQAKEIFGSRRIQSALIQKHRTKMNYNRLFQQYLDDSIHQIDLARFFCGELEPCSTFVDKRDGKISGAVSLLNIPGGGLATILTSNAAGAWQESVTLHGDGISVHIDAFQQLTVKDEEHEVVYGNDRAGKWIRDLRERGFEGEIRHFLDCVQSRQTPLTSAEEAAKTQVLLEELVRLSGEEI